MRRSSVYYPLEWRVECKRPPNPATWWETVAAFNSDRVALDYARDCRKANGKYGFEYRVMARKGRGWVEITKPGI